MGRGKAARSLEMIDAARAILAEIHPAGLRAVCYRFFVLGLIRSMSQLETDKMSRQLTDAPERGWIYQWIVDETRNAERVSSWADPATFVETVSRSCRRDHRVFRSRRVEVWSQKGSIRGKRGPMLERYSVTFCVMHDYASTTAVYRGTEEHKRDRRLMTVFYVGDWDPSGLHVSEVDLPEGLRGRSQLEVGRKAEARIKTEDVVDANRRQDSSSWRALS